MSDISGALQHLRKADPVMKSLIELHGNFALKPHTNYYYELVSSIISQQLSIKAAATIEKRFVELFNGDFPTPEQILATNFEALRGVGMSRPKASYVIDLAQHVVDGRLQPDTFARLNNEQIITELTAVKGIGEWTAHMFLIFALGRLNVMPVGDLGIRNGIMNLYGLDHLPSPEECRAIADNNKWHPYESVAAWYIWKALDNKPA